ncbi:Uncharacterised protein [uncultured archaeon]|nr:Uncharacterised protein [uncultured archaeon]
MGLIENRDGQFMLLAGFIIGIELVLTTVMLTSIIFEVNMATGGEIVASKNDIVNLMQITKDETRDAYTNATMLWGSKAQMINNFNKQTLNFTNNLSKIYALHGEGVNVSWDVSNWNNLQNASFTDNGTANGIANWTVIENVTYSKINITLNKTDNKFQIGLINRTKPKWINLTGTDSFGFINSTSSDPYSIVFSNGNTTFGNYSITGIASGKNFTRARTYILNATVMFYTSRVRANITIPVSVPW